MGGWGPFSRPTMRGTIVRSWLLKFDAVWVYGTLVN